MTWLIDTYVILVSIQSKLLWGSFHCTLEHDRWICSNKKHWFSPERLAAISASCKLSHATMCVREQANSTKCKRVRLNKETGYVTEYALPWWRLSCHSMETFIPFDIHGLQGGILLIHKMSLPWWGGVKNPPEGAALGANSLSSWFLFFYNKKWLVIELNCFI